MAGQTKLTGINLHIAERMLADVAHAFDATQVPYWLEGGTLLGLVREQRLLPWDNDLDVSVKAEVLEQVLRAVRKLSRLRFYVRVRRVKEDNAHFAKGTVRLIKLYNTRWFGLRRGEVCLDIFLKYAKGDQTYWMVGRKVKSVPAHFYDAFKRLEFKGYRYSIPANTDDYLTFRYGDWKTPVQEWNTFKDDNALITRRTQA